MTIQMPYAHSFSGNYMVLTPEDVSLCDLFAILFCNRDLSQRPCLDCPTGREENLQVRWRIFVSLSGQKVLQFVSKPLLRFGSQFEMWLNILSCYNNFCVLFLHVLQGKVIKPDRTSEKFLSFVGILDRRMQLDKNINYGDSRYYPMLCAMASKLSYENKTIVETTVRDCWKMELLGYYDFWNGKQDSYSNIKILNACDLMHLLHGSQNGLHLFMADFQRKHTTQAFMFHDKTTDPDVIIIAFRGTELFDADAWCTDIDISWYELHCMGKVHGGFMKALGLLMRRGWPKEIEQDNDRPLAYYTLREKLRDLLNQNSKTRFIVTGHSLGGALAILFPAVLALHKEEKLLKRLDGVYTFGQPRVGDEEFKMFMEKQMVKYGFKYFRFVYCDDVITRMPSDDSTFLFKHFGTCIYFNSFYQGKIVEEQPYKNYIYMSPFAMIPRILNAVLEILRSFIISYTKGPDFAETWLLRLIRFIGLALPGLAAHNLQDYVNVTRLASPNLYFQASTTIIRIV